MSKEATDKTRLVFSRNIKKCRVKAFPGHGGGRRCAAAFGVAPSQWSHWENNRRYPDEYIRTQLAEFFNVPEKELRKQSFSGDAVAVKGDRVSRSNRQTGDMGAGDVSTLSERLITDIVRIAAPRISERLVSQLVPAVMDAIIARAAPAIMEEVRRKIVGTSFAAAGSGAKPGSRNPRSARAAK